MKLEIQAYMLKIITRYKRILLGFFFRRHFEQMSKFNVGVKTFLRESLVSEPEIYGDLVYIFKKLIERNDFFRSV